MSDNPFTKPFTLSLNSSLQKCLIIIIPHLIALVVVSIVGFEHLVLMATLFILVLLSLYYFLRLHVYRSLRNSVQSIHQDSASNWFLTTSDNKQKQASLLPSSFYSNMLIILNYIDISEKQFIVLITPDSISKDEFRRLRVRLKKH